MRHVLVLLAASALLGSVSSQVTLTQCPVGWLQWQTYCYQFVNNATEKVRWSQANSECADRQGHLLRIETADEYDFVKKGLLQFPSDAYWTALNNQPEFQGGAAKPTFMWGNDEFPLDAVVGSHWDKEPDNSDAKDCVFVSIQATLSVNDCNERHGYICEIQHDEDEDCPDGWKDAYLGSNHCYYVSSVNWTATLTWDKARKTCEAYAPFQDTRRARLIGITDANVQTFLAQYLPAVVSTRQVYWTGLNDLATEGTFVWAGNEGQAFNGAVVVWRQEPNNLAGNEHCGALLEGGAWSDADCSDRKNFVCRLTLNPADLFNFGCGQWTRAGHKCVYVYSQQKNWADARAYCQQQGGDLYKFYDDDDRLWLQTQAQRVLLRPGYYIGLNDQAQENTFVWADGSASNGTYLPWNRQPSDNGLGYMQEKCAKMSLKGTFASGRCNFAKAGSVCEEKTAHCAAGWSQHGGSCYLVDTTYRTHDEAADHCHDVTVSGKGVLFALNSQDEKDFITGQLAATQNAPFQYWSDLNNKYGGGWGYTNSADNVAANIQNLVTWDTEPNNYNDNEDCVQVNADARLNDFDCSKPAGFICQKLLNV